MAAFYIANLLWKKGKLKSTEKVSHGRRCEEFALKTYQKIGYCLIEKNLRLKMAECDLVLEKGGIVLLVEVRGKKNSEKRPSRFLSRAKLQRLKLSAEILSQKYKKSVHVELFEVLGEFPGVETTRFPIVF